MINLKTIRIAIIISALCTSIMAENLIQDVDYNQTYTHENEDTLSIQT